MAGKARKIRSQTRSTTGVRKTAGVSTGERRAGGTEARLQGWCAERGDKDGGTMVEVESALFPKACEEGGEAWEAAGASRSQWGTE